MKFGMSKPCKSIARVIKINVSANFQNDVEKHENIKKLSKNHDNTTSKSRQKQRSEKVCTNETKRSNMATKGVPQSNEHC